VTCSRAKLIVLALLASAVAAVAGCGSAGHATPAVAPVTPVAAVPAELRVRVGGRIVTVAFEDYVAGTALSEVTPVGESPRTVDRIYDVQTIVARTYALAHLGRHRAEGFDLCDSTHCQLYEPARLGTSRFAGDVRRAVERTAGQILIYGARPIDALFHADCGGHTTSPEQVWGTAPLPYLRPEPDRAPGLTHRTWTLTLTREQLRTALNADPRTAVGRTLRSMVIDSIDSSGRIAGLLVTGERQVDIRSDDFRAVVNRTLGAKGILSTRFSIRASSAGYVLTGTGYGHGIGLCQQGALARARRDEPTETILSSYFPGASLHTPGGRIP
jgi:stage II sporulation protein D